MGWLWSSSSNQDPYEKLDPSLREFLEKESPVKYHDTKPSTEKLSKAQQAAQTPSADGPQTSYRTQVGLLKPSQEASQQQAAENKPTVPPESLFQDGRYAYLWKNYRPQAEIDAAGKTDHDRLADVVSAFKDRKAAIGRAAMENCVEFQIAEQECFRGGLWRKGMGMCRTEAKSFNRCYEMQQRFLKALGYLSDGLNVPGQEMEEERIQMHADKLYNEMLEREQAAEKAKAEGTEIPSTHKQPLLRTETGAPLSPVTEGKETAWTRLRQQVEAAGPNDDLDVSTLRMPGGKAEKLKENWKTMSPAQRQLELDLLEAEANSTRSYAVQIKEHFDEEKTKRAERRDRGRETVGDAIKRWAGWDKE